MEYYILQTNSLIELENEVNEKIKEGYKPQGGLSVACVYIPGDSLAGAEVCYYCTQAMVKE